MKFSSGGWVKLGVTALLCTPLATGLFALLDKRAALGSPYDEFLALCLGLALFVGASRRIGSIPPPGTAARDRTRLWIGSLVGFAILLKLLYLDLPDLVPEEAYYWVYAQHPALSYLDHPPMVAWGIRAGTALLGDTEAGVRLFTLLCWFTTLGFLAGLTGHLHGKQARLPVLLLGALLPYPFLFGFFATPDAPLMAAWAGALYFLERALLGGKGHAWWGFGICTGLGMLSKYTFALLGPSTLAVLLLDRDHRRWLLRPQPWLSVLLALIIFSPVLYWNQQHDWVGFGFQSSRRFQERPEFKLPELLLFVFALLTPMGIVGAFHAIRSSGDWILGADADDKVAGRRRLLFVTVTLLPFAVFFVFSFTHRTKISWTGPIWLALLPVLAAQLATRPDEGFWNRPWLRPRLWVPTMVLLSLFYGGAFWHMSLGIPLLPYPGRTVKPVAWEEFGREMDTILNRLEREEGQEPLLIGIDRHFIASEASFYRRDKDKSMRTTRTERVYGGNGTMYEYWFPDRPPKGTLMLFVSFDRDTIDDPRIHAHVKDLGPIHEQQVTKRGRPAGGFFYRVGRGYDPSPKKR